MKAKRTIRMGDNHLDSWFKNMTFRVDAIRRCDSLSVRFSCPVELISDSEGVLYKVFPS